MTVFHYTARGKTGNKTEGDITAPSRYGAIKQLEQQGLVPISVSDTSVPPPVPHIEPKVRWQFIALFAFGMLLVIAAGAGIHVHSSTYRLSKAERLADAGRFAECISYISAQPVRVSQSTQATNILLKCWMGTAHRMSDAGHYQDCIDYIRDNQPLRQHRPAINLFLSCKGNLAMQAYSKQQYQTCLDIIAEIEPQVVSLPPHLIALRQQARDVSLLPQVNHAKALLRNREYSACLAILNSLPVDFSLTREVKDVRRQAQRGLDREREDAERKQRTEARRFETERREQDIRSANAAVSLTLSHVITKKLLVPTFFGGEKEIYRYFFRIHNTSAGFTPLKGRLSVMMRSSQDDQIGWTNFATLDVSPNLHHPLALDSKTGPNALGYGARFEWEYIVDGVVLRTGSAQLSSAYEDLTQ